MSAFAMLVGLTIGNFLWQWTRIDPDWGSALERSWFQAVAVGLVLLLGK